MSNFICFIFKARDNPSEFREGERSVECLSSRAMTKMILWRNPLKTEANWIFRRMTNAQRPPLFKLFSTQIAFGCLTLIALVETVVLSIFTILCLPLNYISVKRPLQSSFSLLNSASFTILWAFGNLFFNFVSPNLLTKEKFARDYVFNGGVSPDDVR